MKNRCLTLALFFLFFFVSFAQNASEDEVLLKTNEKYTGKIILQNEQVVILQIENNARLQFPLADIKAIRKASDSSLSPDENGKNGKKITLKTGEIYRGEILVEDERMLMLKTVEGNRFQIRKSEIESMEQDALVEVTEENANISDKISVYPDNKFAMIADISGGTSFSKNSYGWVPSVQGVLVLGGKDIFIPNTFIGIGTGYNVLFPSANPEEFISIIPIFARIQSIIGKRITAPYIEFDAGYGLSANSNLKGGMLFKLSVGVAHKFNSHTVFYGGIYAGLQGLSGRMQEINQWNEVYSYDGSTITQQVGAKIAFSF